MKEHNIDELFRQKLQQHRVAPTPAAWDKVASNLSSRRRKRGGYYAAAAAVVLLLSLGWVGLRQEGEQDLLSSQPQTTVAVREQATAPTTLAPAEAETKEQPIQETVEPAIAAEETKKAATSASQAPAPAQLAATQKTTSGAAPGKMAPGPAEKEERAPLLQPHVAEVQLETALAQELPAAPSSQSASLPITEETVTAPLADIPLASTEQVVIRYDAADATDEDRNNAPEKVLSLMKKVKHGEIGLADIRKAKDNLFSGRFNKP